MAGTLVTFYPGVTVETIEAVLRYAPTVLQPGNIQPQAVAWLETAASGYVEVALPGTDTELEGRMWGLLLQQYFPTAIHSTEACVVI